MARPSDPQAKIRLLTAAEAEFTEQGLEHAKVEAITTRAGLSKGAFYLHFESKEDAFRQLVETMVARLAGFMDTDMRAEIEGALAKDFESFLDLWLSKDVAVFEFVWQNRGLMRLLLEGGGGSKYRHLIEDFADRSSCNIEGALRTGIARGVYRSDLDLELACAMIAGAYDRYARRVVRATKKPNLERALREMQRMVLRGVGSASTIAHLDPKVRNARRRKGKGTEEAA